MHDFELKHLDLFAGCTKKELKHAARLVTGVIVPPGRELMAEGDVGRECMIICSGTAAVLHDGEPVHHAKAGDLIGEMALMGDAHARTATVVTETECALLALTTREFEELVEAIPVVASRVDHEVVRRLVDLVQRSSD